MSKDEVTNNRKWIAITAALWLLTTVISLIVVAGIEIHPFGASREARITDDAFDLLMIFAIPVMTFVLVMGGVALVRGRGGNSDEDGPAIRSNGLFIGAWIVITSVLSIVVIITPGFSGLDELRAEPEPDLIIDVRAERWSWAYTYSESGVESQETLMLPIDRRIMFRITSTDVIHSFWVPAFRIKQDAVPGQVTTTMVTPEKLGTYDNADEMRVQCAELCGVGHARMWTGVTVVSQADFDAWLTAMGG